VNREAQSKPPLTILLVEDHPDTLEAMGNWLRSKGYQVVTATDMKSALKVGREQGFDLLLSDLQLPDGDGWTLLEKLRGEREILAVAISGHGAPADLERSEQAGFLAHVLKPCSPTELAAVLAGVERSRRIGTPPRLRRKSSAGAAATGGAANGGAFEAP